MSEPVANTTDTDDADTIIGNGEKEKEGASKRKVNVLYWKEKGKEKDVVKEKRWWNKEYKDQKLQISNKKKIEEKRKSGGKIERLQWSRVREKKKEKSKGKNMKKINESRHVKKY